MVTDNQEVIESSSQDPDTAPHAQPAVDPQWPAGWSGKHHAAAGGVEGNCQVFG